MRYSVANLAERASGSTFEAITGKQLRTHRLPVAPLAEQKRIVDAIEEHFSHLDAAEATLRLTLKRLDTLRSSILADAFHTNRKLPEGWKWAKLGDLCLPIQNINPRTIPNLQFKYIDIGGIDPNLGVVRYTKSLRGSGAPSRARQLVRSGDIVLSTVRTYQKKTAIVPSELDGAIASTGFAVLRPAPSVNSWFIFYQVRATNFVDSLNMMQTGTSYPAIRDNDVRSSFVRIAPAGEQERIVAYIEQRFSHLDALAAIANVSLERISALRRSILAAAFSGRLVPQDPEDEPASILLERIAASRAAEPARRRART